MYGKGLNSIRTRFALMMGGFSMLGIIALMILDQNADIADMGYAAVSATVFLALVIPMLATWLIAGNLTGTIEALRQSTDAIARGDFDTEVKVDCACEVGGLADSFRTMVARLNSNLLKINILAYTDAVTGLPNRAVVRHALEFGLSPERGPDRLTGGLLFIDLDNFKHVNDTLGHDGGDDLLRSVCDRILIEGLGTTRQSVDHCTNALGELCEAIPSKVVFARFAGDEFVALLPGVTDPALLAQFGQRIVAAIQRPFEIKATSVKIGASIGIAIMHQDSSDAEGIITCADLAMYAAKDAGRNRIAFYSAAMGEMAIDRARTEAELRTGIEAGQLCLVFQPKITVDTLAIHSVEALVRWQHPERGLLDPGAFIEIAEQTGLIDPLGQEVLRLAAIQCRAWLDQGIRRRIAVNVCHTQFHRADFAERVLSIIADQGMPYDLLELEVTETVAMAYPELAIQHLNTLRGIGITIAIDDFGVGYSNLSQLAAMPFDTLKIDRSLVAGIGCDAKREQIITAIVQMSRAMGHGIVAEGVETIKQFEFLAERNCDYIQGYLLARPMSADRISTWERDNLAPWKHRPVRAVPQDARVA